MQGMNCHMKHFEEILRTIGAREVQLVKEAANWDFWSAVYITPVATVTGYYLYLKHSCPLKEATGENLAFWRTAAKNNEYDAVITQKSDLAHNPVNTKSAFHARKVSTSRQLLQDNVFSGVKLRDIDIDPYFIDPDIELEDGKTIRAATNYLINWMLGEGKPEQAKANLAVLRADGGIGKTTLARCLAKKIRVREPNVVPLLIESEQWRFHLQSSIEMRNIWDIAISRTLATPAGLLSNDVALRVLIREGLLVVIFDGFDELCLNPLSPYRPSDIIADLAETCGSDEGPTNARILLTTRETFWDSFSEEVDASTARQFRLCGFTNSQRKEYFKNRLKDPAERDTALRIAKQVGGGLYTEITPEEEHEDRPSGVPFLLDMIAHFVEDNPGAEINPYKADPLAPLLEAMCKREDTRHNLGIPPAKQMLLFEELFREHSQEIALDDIRLYLEVIGEVTDRVVVNSFTSHSFMVRTAPDRFAPRYEVLRVYFIARFLANGLRQLRAQSDRQKIASILAQSPSGHTQLVDWLMGQLKALDGDTLVTALHHAHDIVCDPENATHYDQSSMALFNIVDRLIATTGDKEERTARLLTYFGGKQASDNKRLSRVVLNGLVRAFDFRGVDFSDCRCVDVEFKNCIFDNTTRLINCKLQGGLTFNSCQGEDQLKTEDCKATEAAEYTLDQVHKQQPREEVRMHLAEEALTRALRKFRGQFGYTSVKYNNRLKGMDVGNPYNAAVWESLERNKVVERHPISNVKEGGLNLRDDSAVRKEVITYIDSGYAGPQLSRVITQAIN